MDGDVEVEAEADAAEEVLGAVEEVLGALGAEGDAAEEVLVADAAEVVGVVA